LHELGIDLLFSLGVVKWKNATVSMRGPSQLRGTEIDAFEAEMEDDPDATELLESKKLWISSMPQQQILMKWAISTLISQTIREKT
jgi:hypothetical protein